MFGQPNVAERRLENPIVVPYVLSFLAYGSFGATVHGLDDFPKDTWPDNIELLYFGYHIMAGLGDAVPRAHGASRRWLLLARTLAHRDPERPLGAHARVPLPFHRDDRGLDGRRARAATVARLRAPSHVADGTARRLSAPVTSCSRRSDTWGLYLVVGVNFLGLVGKAVARGPASRSSALRTGAEARSDG